MHQIQPESLSVKKSMQVFHVSEVRYISIFLVCEHNIHSFLSYADCKLLWTLGHSDARTLCARALWVIPVKWTQAPATGACANLISTCHEYLPQLKKAICCSKSYFFSFKKFVKKCFFLQKCSYSFLFKQVFGSKLSCLVVVLPSIMDS